MLAMRKIVFSLLIIGGFIVTACDKEKDPIEPTASCPAGINICANFGAEKIEGQAVWYRIPLQKRFRILWEDGTDDDYKNVEFDVYTADTVLAPGTYTINNSRVQGAATLQFYKTRVAWAGTAGSLEIKTVSAGKMNGVFTGTVTNPNSNETITISSGVLQAVPRQF